MPGNGTRWGVDRNAPDLGSRLLSFVAGGTLSRNAKVGTEFQRNERWENPYRYCGNVSLGQGAAALFGAEGLNGMPRGLVRMRDGAGDGKAALQVNGCGAAPAGGGVQAGKGAPTQQQKAQRTGHHISGAIPGMTGNESGTEKTRKKPRKQNEHKKIQDSPGSVVAQDIAGQARGSRGGKMQDHAPESAGIQVVGSASPDSGIRAAPARSGAQSNAAGNQHDTPAVARGQARSMKQHAAEPPPPPPGPLPPPAPAPGLPLRPVMPSSGGASDQARAAANTEPGGEMQSLQRQPELPGTAQGEIAGINVGDAEPAQAASEEVRESGTVYSE